MITLLKRVLTHLFLMKKQPKKISKAEIIDFLIRVYCYVPKDSFMRYEIKKFTARLREEDYE